MCGGGSAYVRELHVRFVPTMADGDIAIDWVVFASNNSPPPNDSLRPLLTIVAR